MTIPGNVERGIGVSFADAPSPLLAFVLLAACAPPPAVTVPSGQVHAETPQREEDEYSRYELLEPGSAQFHILFEVTASEPGATVYFNPIRKGSAASDEAVRDRPDLRDRRRTDPSGLHQSEAGRDRGVDPGAA